MKKLFSSPDNAEVELIKNMLADSDIVCEVRNGEVSRVVPAPSFYEELWVSEDSYPRAAELLASWQQPNPAAAASWTCPSCGELVEAQFSSCWKCGTPRSTNPATA